MKKIDFKWKIIRSHYLEMFSEKCFQSNEVCVCAYIHTCTLHKKKYFQSMRSNTEVMNLDSATLITVNCIKMKFSYWAWNRCLGFIKSYLRKIGVWGQAGMELTFPLASLSAVLCVFSCKGVDNSVWQLLSSSGTAPRLLLQHYTLTSKAGEVEISGGDSQDRWCSTWHLLSNESQEKGHSEGGEWALLLRFLSSGPHPTHTQVLLPWKCFLTRSRE